MLPTAAPGIAAATSKKEVGDSVEDDSWEFSSSSSDVQAPYGAPLLPENRARGPPPHLERSDVLRALAFAPREAPQAFQGLLNGLPGPASARVGADGVVYVWLWLQFGSAPEHEDASAGDRRSEFIQVTRSPTVIYQPRQPDAWDAALR